MIGFNVSELSGDTRYTQNVARVRALEEKLIPDSKFIKLAQSKNVESLIDELRGTAYEEFLTNVHSYLQLKSSLSSIIEMKRKLITELSIDPVFLNAVVSFYDFNNLKMLVNQKLNDIQNNITLSRSGSINPKDIVNGLKNEVALPGLLDNAYSLINKDFEASKSLFRLKMLIEKSYLENLLGVFSGGSIPFLHYLVGYYVDFTRINQVLRWKELEERLGNNAVKSKKIDLSLLPRGSFISDEILIELYSQGVENINNILAFTPFSDAFNDGVETHKEGNLWILEKEADDFLTQFCSSARYAPFGIEPLIAFLWYLFIELKNLRLVLISKFAGVRPDKIILRLRKCYV
jgi:V/A-type H+-transporting ATPase subunit C